MFLLAWWVECVCLHIPLSRFVRPLFLLVLSLVVRHKALSSPWRFLAYTKRSCTPPWHKDPGCTAVRRRGGVDCFFCTAWGVQMKHSYFSILQTEGKSPQWHCCPWALLVHAYFVIMRSARECTHTQTHPSLHKLQFQNDLIFFWPSKEQKWTRSAFFF